VRREIGIRTVFNILGPLTNPAGARCQLIGVAYPELGEKIAEVMRLLNTHHSLVVHGEGGLDEMTLAGRTSVWEVKDSQVGHWTLDVDETGLEKMPLDAIRGGDREQNADTMKRLFRGEPGPIRDVVLLNSAGVLLAADAVADIREGIQRAAEVIDSGAALGKLEALVELSQTAREA
jgi:anthranilate phosphoribosyltransferase